MPNKCKLNSNSIGTKIWLDDLRPAPEGYTLVKSVNDAKAFIEQTELAVVIDLIERKFELYSDTDDFETTVRNIAGAMESEARKENGFV